MANFLDRDRVAAFFDYTRSVAEEEQQSGYISDEWPTTMAMNRFYGELAQVTGWLDTFDVPRGACLDLGCGTGIWLEHWSARFERVDAIDLSAEMTASAQKFAERRGLTNTQVKCMSALDLPEDQKYDFIFVGGVFLFLNDGETDVLMAKLRRLLTPRGLLVLRESTHVPDTWYRDTPTMPGLFAREGESRPAYYAIYRPPALLRELVSRHDLSILTFTPNLHYKLYDMTEIWLRMLNWLSFGHLAKHKGHAELVARWIYLLRFITLLPEYLLIRTFVPRLWKLDNYWIVCRPQATP